MTVSKYKFVTFTAAVAVAVWNCVLHGEGGGRLGWGAERWGCGWGPFVL